MTGEGERWRELRDRVFTREEMLGAFGASEGPTPSEDDNPRLTLADALERAQKAAHGLSDVFDALEVDLGPVLTPERTTTSTEFRKEGEIEDYPHSPAVFRVEELTRLLERHHGRIRHLMGRIAL